MSSYYIQLALSSIHASFSNSLGEILIFLNINFLLGNDWLSLSSFLHYLLDVDSNMLFRVLTQVVPLVPVLYL